MTRVLPDYSMHYPTIDANIKFFEQYVSNNGENLRVEYRRQLFHPYTIDRLTALSQQPAGCNLMNTIVRKDLILIFKTLIEKGFRVEKKYGRLLHRLAENCEATKITNFMKNSPVFAYVNVKQSLKPISLFGKKSLEEQQQVISEMNEMDEFYLQRSHKILAKFGHDSHTD